MATDKTAKPGAAASAAFPDQDFRKYMADLKLPGMPDVEAVLAAHRKNMEALTEANRTALEGAQAIAKRHMEILQQTSSELTDALRQIAASPQPTDRAIKHAEMLRQAYEHGVANTRELGELIQKTNAEAMTRLSTRFREAMDEMQTLFRKN